LVHLRDGALSALVHPPAGTSRIAVGVLLALGVRARRRRLCADVRCRRQDGLPRRLGRLPGLRSGRGRPSRRPRAVALPRTALWL